MQAVRRDVLEKRARYYHSQMDMELLISGTAYSELSDTYVIFICDFDPFGDGKYCYTFENTCLESVDRKLQDGSKSIFLSTHGKNEDEVTEALVRFLKFVKADLAESMQDFEDEFVECLQNCIRRIKASREMEGRFLSLYDMIQDEKKEAREEGLAEGRAEGRAEGLALGKAEAIIELLQEFGDVSGELHDRILKETEGDVLKHWLKLAAKADSMEQFLKDM